MKKNKIQIAVVIIPYLVLLTKFVMNHNIAGSVILTIYAVLIYNFISLFKLIDMKEVNFKRIHRNLFKYKWLLNG